MAYAQNEYWPILDIGDHLQARPSMIARAYQAASELNRYRRFGPQLTNDTALLFFALKNEYR